MSKLYLIDIASISKSTTGSGYEILFNDGRVIYIHKRRTIPALLTLIEHGEGCEGDLTNSTNNLSNIKQKLAGKIPDNLIQESYSDANKPFSELWNEEGFNFIKNPPGEKRLGSQKYVLEDSDHDKLFSASKKAKRSPPDKATQKEILIRQFGKCNFCGSILKTAAKIPHDTFAKDRVRIVWDHRIPVEKGGDSEKNNYQALCFYCNKCKWQICNICNLDSSSCDNCALSSPESGTIIAPTNEDKRLAKS